MAKPQINTKSRSYLRDKEVFLKDLKQFNDSKNITVKPPIVNGIEIDLYLFYTLVQQRGGIGKVNQNDVWESFLRPLRLPHPCINGSTLLRRIYGTHLEKYERTKGPPGRDDDMELDEDPRRGRGGNMPRITFSGGTYISASGEALRTATKPSPAPSERLALSLLSPMPNEQDFAVNVCTVLAADHSNRLPLSTTPHILDFLLAHAGVYNHSSLRETIGRSYYEARGRYPDEFWRLRAGGGGARELADEIKFMQIGVEQPELMVQAMAAHNNLTDCLMRDGSDDEGSEKAIGELQDILEDWVTEPSEESSLFAPELVGGASCVYTQRVLQVASIVRSLSFHEDNVHYLARNTTLIRFLLLCANCWVGTLRQSGLDTLGNISTELIIKDPATCLISRHILSTIQSALVSPDRARVLAALELLNKLSQNEANEDALLKALESKVYHDVCALLTLRDIMVLVCTLECVYALTSLGDRASEAVARVPGLVHTLVSLVTVEAQSYGPRACILMRVVETVSGPAALAAVADQQTNPQPQVQVQAKPVVEQVAPAAPSPAPAPASPAPVNSLQQSHMHQKTVQENENFALAWLRSSFEPLPPHDNSTFEAAELYRQYMACCAKLARKGVIAPQHFPRLVRTVFGGTVGPNTASTSTGETQQVYVGIRSRNPQNRANVTPASPASPILKAQLTNKAAAEAKAAASQPQPQQTPTHPHLSQALESNPTNTTLIKHLLAHKVSPAPAQPQVAQRQQNQQRGPSTSNTVVVQPPSQAMEVDPEAMIKCTAITPGGIASITPAVQEKVIVNASEEMLVCKEEPVQIQIDEQSQLTIKTAQNKMLADLLEKKSNPPVQVVQMGSSINAPTIQITETGQIVQVKSDQTPVIQINEAGVLSQGNQFFQIKNEQGQLIQIKNDQGQIIQLKTDQLQQPLLQFKNDQIVIKSEGNVGQLGQLIQGQVGQLFQGQVGQSIQNIKLEKDIVEHVITDHSYTEPPSKKIKLEEKKEAAPQESVSKTAANLYAALAASALEDEEDLLPPLQPKLEPVEVQQPTMQVQQPTLQVQQPTMQVQGNTIQVQQPTMQVQQPMLQVQPMDVQNIMASQPGQLILQEKTISSQPQYVQQQMQLIATPSTSQGGLSYITQNIPTNMMQKTIIIVQGTGGGPLTLTVNNPGGLDEATLNSLIAQATEAITQQQIIQNTGMLQSAQRVIIPQQTLVNTSQPNSSNTGLIQSSQRVIMTPTLVSTSQPTVSNTGLLHSTQRVIMGQPGLVSSSQPTSSNTGIIQSTQRMIMTPQLVSASQPTSNSGIIQTTQRVMMPQTTIVSSSQSLASNSGIIQSAQRVIMSPQPSLVSTSQPIIASSTPQITPSQQPLITTQPQPHKAQLVNQTQQIVVTNKNPPALISTSSSNQQIIVSSNQIMNSPMKTVGHRTVQPQRSQVINVQNQPVQDNKAAAKPQQPLIRQVITRQPIMVGNTKIGDKETVVNQPIIEQKPVLAPAPSPVAPVVKPAPSATPPPLQPTQEDTPWICHWRGCGKAFPNAGEVFSHCARVHCPGGAAGEAPCLWAECDRVPRRTFALLNHLTDKHCSPQALKAMYNTRRQLAAEAEANKPVSLGYPPNAALAALNKHAADMFNPRELMNRAELSRPTAPEAVTDENEGPVTKSIRLTAALILRNIVIYSNTGRRQLRSYEAHLACIALSSVEASRTIAQVLYDMNNI